MGHIYKITHIESGKLYIGKTHYSIQDRFKQHIYNSHSKTSKSYNFHLHRAIRKYGESAFSVEEIESCPDADLNEREEYWIRQYDSVRSGYNMTYGGEGKVEHDSGEILEAWNEGLNMSEISLRFGICWRSVNSHLKKNGVTDKEIRKRRYDSSTLKRCIPVYQYGIDGKFVGEYPSVKAAVKKYKNNNIYSVLTGKINCASGYLWSYQKKERTEPYHYTGPRPVYQYSMDGDYIGQYETQREAEISLGKRNSCIGEVCIGRRKSSCGYRWSYEKKGKLPPITYSKVSNF